MMRISLIFTLIVTSLVMTGQGVVKGGHICHYEVIDGDTVAVVNLDLAVVCGPRVFKSDREKRKYDRLVRKVIKVYPYAFTAGELMRQYEIELKAIASERDQKIYIKDAERALKERFEGELRKLTITEGIILIKLIDRETGDTSYQLIQELKGSLSAFMWQSVARLFGHNLKDNYDPFGDDWDIEEIVREIELGMIPIDLPERKTAQR